MMIARSLFLVWSAFVFPVTVMAAATSASCASAVAAHAEIEPAAGAQTARDFLAAHPELPAFLKRTPHGLVPVFLVNADTYATLRPLVVSSVGYGFEQRPGIADHGVLRVENTLMDLDHPTKRAFGEINGNGIAWKEVDEFLARKRPLIQISYLMSDADRATVRGYQLARRAALFTTQFFFAPTKTEARGNFLPEIVENCHGFCKSDLIWRMGDVLRARVAAMNTRGADGLPADVSVRAAVDAGTKALLAADERSATSLNRLTPARAVGDLEVIPGANARAKVKLLNLLVSLRAVEAYSAILAKYEISDNAGLDDLAHRAAAFVLIYDSPEKAASFHDASYTSPGDSFHWDATAQVPSSVLHETAASQKN